MPLDHAANRWNAELGRQYARDCRSDIWSSWRVCQLSIIPRENNHAVGFLCQWPAIKSAKYFPALKAGDFEKEGHLFFVYPARGELGPLQEADFAVGIRQFNFIYGILRLQDTIETARVIHAQWQPVVGMLDLQLENPRVLCRAEVAQAGEKSVEG